MQLAGYVQLVVGSVATSHDEVDHREQRVVGLQAVRIDQEFVWRSATVIGPR